MFFFDSLFLGLLLAAHSYSQILFKCPKANEVQSDYVKMHFNLTEFARNQTYYEIAYKDITQPRMCKCITSRKQYNPSSRQIFDAFTIECAGKPYHSDLVFNESDSRAPGVFVGVWNQKEVPILSRLRFPDTVVDVGVSRRADGSENYDWIIEFQCNEGPGGLVLFYAFNFYSSTNSMEHYDAMQSAFLKAGLERFLVEGAKIQLVNHKDCWYDEKVEKL